MNQQMKLKLLKEKPTVTDISMNLLNQSPVESFTDKYGTIDDKIETLNERIKEDANSLISLSLCHLLKGDTDTAIDYLFKSKKNSTISPHPYHYPLQNN